MTGLKRAIVAGVATLLAAGACASINAPTIPPINLPNFSFPPIVLPSGGIDFPGLSFPPGSTPCTLVTSAEVGQVMGSAVTDTSDSATDCTFITSGFSTVSVSTDTGTDLSGVQFLMGNTAQQINVAGFPALRGTALGFPAVYVQKGGNQLTVLGFLINNDQNTTLDRMVQLATIAVARMP